MIFRIFIQVAVMCFISWLLCDIESYEKYYWYSGIWHGLFLPANFIRYLIFDDVLFKAAHCSTAYTIFYWIFGFFSILSFLFGREKSSSFK